MAAKRPTNPTHRILVVDDDRDIRRFSAHALIGSGYHVDAAEDAAAAWEALQIKAFNLLITDNNMPKLTGVELVRKLRSARMALPVIMATGKLPTEGTGPKSVAPTGSPAAKAFLHRRVVGNGEGSPARHQQYPRAARITARLAKPATG
jgi:CheY-like chemotaxis protein